MAAGHCDPRRFLDGLYLVCSTAGRLGRWALTLYDNRPEHSAVHHPVRLAAWSRDFVTRVTSIRLAVPSFRRRSVSLSSLRAPRRYKGSGRRRSDRSQSAKDALLRSARETH